MAVGADVMNSNGFLLLSKGTVLTQRHLQVLDTWGIESVMIAGDEPAPAPVAPPLSSAMKKVEAEIDRRFQHVQPDLPVVQFLRQLASARLAAQSANERSGLKP